MLIFTLNIREVVVSFHMNLLTAAVAFSWVRRLCSDCIRLALDVEAAEVLPEAVLLPPSSLAQVVVSANINFHSETRPRSSLRKRLNNFWRKIWGKEMPIELEVTEKGVNPPPQSQFPYLGTIFQLTWVKNDCNQLLKNHCLQTFKSAKNVRFPFLSSSLFPLISTRNIFTSYKKKLYMPCLFLDIQFNGL